MKLKIRDIDLQGVVLILKDRLPKAIKENDPICSLVYSNYDPNSEVQIIADRRETIKNLM